MKISWNQMIVLGSAALFFTAYAPQSAVAEGQSLGQEESLTPEKKIELRVDEEYVFDEVPG